ncbi:hypothetical protein ACFV7Q_38660, partial [Streptomyces sp. NPDC059851]|uniref:hypothetical protein n=1 Tax=Streptomyces sp. NPDC059851 TaxID=3346971 RepID=UPI00365A4090
IFGTLLSSQGTDASFVLTLSGFPPGFRSCVSDSIRVFSARFPGLRFRVFPFSYPDLISAFPVLCNSAESSGRLNGRERELKISY